MNIETRKISLVQQLLAIEKETILDKIEAILKKESELSDEQKESIDNGLKSLLDEESISHQQVLNETKARYSKLFK